MATPAVARVGPALEEMEPYGLRTQEGRAADQAFHYLILQSTPNEPLVILSNSTAASVDWTTIYARHERSELRDPVPDHHAVLEALAKVDARDAYSVPCGWPAGCHAPLAAAGSGGASRSWGDGAGAGSSGAKRLAARS